ncbi:MAG TPA: ADOP family duplicated permease [Vicinamibacterales bacterium]|nr:ADOP family duplicated permease [Vicinamibacterales bacterium]
MWNWLQDIRLGARSIGRAKGFAASAIGTMAIAIAATVTIFTVVDRVLLRPLPFTGAERVVQLCETSASTAGYCSVSPLNIEDLARGATHIEVAGVARTQSVAAEIGGERIRLSGAFVTAGLFDTLALRPVAGRLLTSEDLAAGPNQVAVVSHDFWRHRLGAAPDAVGSILHADGKDIRIVGVLSSAFAIPELRGIDLWRPISASPDDPGNRAWRGFSGFARIKNGSHRALADAELQERYRQLVSDYPDANAGWTLHLEDLRERLVRPVRQPILLFQVAVSLLLLIACANVGGLLMIRTASRRPEFAIRNALGAGRGRLLRQMFAEGLILSSASAIVGLGIAALTLSALRGIAPPDMPRLAEVGLDVRIVVVTCGLAILIAGIFGVLPVGGGGVVSALRAQRHGGSARVSRIFAMAQLAFAFGLLASAGMVTRAFVALAGWQPGFDRTRLVTSWLVAPPDRVGSIDAGVDALLNGRASTLSLAGVEAAGLVSAGPLFGGSETGALRLAESPTGNPWTVTWFDADEGYFPALGVRALRGRLIEATDTFGSERVAVINDTLARQVFGEANPLGRRITVDTYTSIIVGVVPTILTAPGATPRPEVYWPIRQYRRYAAYLVVRTSADTPLSQAALSRTVTTATPILDVGAPRTLDTRLADAIVAPRFSMWLALAFALAAGAVASTGLYAVIAAAVADRRHEIGVRLALGATPRRMAATFMWQTLTLIAIGGAAGLLLVILSGRVLTRMLYGLPALDLIAIVSAYALLTVAGCLAGYVPAHRTYRIDPVITLRGDG